MPDEHGCDCLRDMIEAWAREPPWVLEYERRYPTLSFEPYPAHPPPAARAAYERYRAGDAAALADLEAELKRIDGEAAVRAIAAMTSAQRQALVRKVVRAARRAGVDEHSLAVWLDEAERRVAPGGAPSDRSGAVDS